MFAELEYTSTHNVCFFLTRLLDERPRFVLLRFRPIFFSGAGLNEKAITGHISEDNLKCEYLTVISRFFTEVNQVQKTQIIPNLKM